MLTAERCRSIADKARRLAASAAREDLIQALTNTAEEFERRAAEIDRARTDSAPLDRVA